MLKPHFVGKTTELPTDDVNMSDVVKAGSSVRALAVVRAAILRPKETSGSPDDLELFTPFPRIRNVRLFLLLPVSLVPLAPM
eukprot:CAMPEP_0169371546 /NCGR_PEP_ID=MMETSP1017-20121227/35962_1 /TAXON_ID=342587 /ORGANISM="Karlodinium micrum, Strain CCMP2283" /LENGTH=81 /DNA_ID=CAMNT_0009470065 /DNA_START=106 /DNA_END=351 /DNA_ORIENTATION=-